MEFFRNPFGKWKEVGGPTGFLSQSSIYLLHFEESIIFAA